MSLDVILSDIAGALGGMLPELKTSELVGGRIDLAEMRRRSRALPGAFVACTATKDGYAKFGKFYCVGFFLVVLAVTSRVEGQPVPQARAHNIARLLSRALIKIAGAGTWGNAEVTSVPKDVSSMNPYSTAADDNNLALWGITWQQDLELTTDNEPAELPDLTEIKVDYKMAESTQPVDAQDLKTDVP